MRSERDHSGVATATRASRAGADLRRFPPTNPHLLVPPRPRLAAMAGLSLYDAVSARQRRLLTLGRAAARAGLIPLVLRTREAAAGPAPEWWDQWLPHVAEPAVGPVRFYPQLIGDGRVRCLLLTHEGRPRGFAKIAPAGAEGVAREGVAHAVLDRASPERFRTPRLLRAERLGSWDYLLFEAIPVVGHRPLPADAKLVAGIIDDLQGCLDGLPTGSGVAPGRVPGHGDFSPRNARITPAGQVWLIDWEDAGWMPRLADELRFWAAGFRGRPSQVSRYARRVVRILRMRGSDEDILEAVGWPEHNTPAEQAVRDRVKALIAAQGRC